MSEMCWFADGFMRHHFYCQQTWMDARNLLLCKMQLQNVIRAEWDVSSSAQLWVTGHDYLTHPSPVRCKWFRVCHCWYPTPSTRKRTSASQLLFDLNIVQWRRGLPEGLSVISWEIIYPSALVNSHPPVALSLNYSLKGPQCITHSGR